MDFNYYKCPVCGGKGADVDCPVCDGWGEDLEGNWCVTCQGNGYTDGFECLDCGYLYTEAEVEELES